MELHANKRKAHPRKQVNIAKTFHEEQGAITKRKSRPRKMGDKDNAHKITRGQTYIVKEK